MRGRKGFCVKRDWGVLVLRDPLSENNWSREPWATSLLSDTWNLKSMKSWLTWCVIVLFSNRLTCEGPLPVLPNLPSSDNFGPRNFFFVFQALYDFVFCDEESPAEFVLVSNFPRKVYALDSASEHQTLEDAGIETNAMLFVQNVEEESDSDWHLTRVIGTINVISLQRLGTKLSHQIVESFWKHMVNKLP